MTPAIESLEHRMLLTPILHSLPGADQVIYIDLNGHTTTGTAFNDWYNQGQPIVSPGVNYSDATITRIWQRVSEDFAPFSVDVTTEEPPLDRLIKIGVGDTQWGVRAVVTADQSWLRDNVGYNVGGIGFIGSFNYANDTPVFIFNQGELYAAETISHEVGHSLGLSHDGTGRLNADGSVTVTSDYYYGHGSGATGWAPIMGAGFGKQLSQWSQGEYPGAWMTQDDVQIIATKNGFSFRPDQADRQLVFGATGNEGIIEQRTDVDTFWFDSFTADGYAMIDVSPALVGPNLDILATLIDSNGNIVASSNPVDRLDATIAVRVHAGRYYLKIDGTGKAAVTGDPGYSDYGSLGQYAVEFRLLAQLVVYIDTFDVQTGPVATDISFQLVCPELLTLIRPRPNKHRSEVTSQRLDALFHDKKSVVTLLDELLSPKQDSPVRTSFSGGRRR